MMALRLSMLMALALSLASAAATAATESRAVAHAASAGDWTYVRDPNGNITKTIAPNGRVSTTSFDALNRPGVTIYEGAGPGEVSKVTRHHDGNGNVTAIDEERDGITRTETRKYDHFDRLEHVTDVHGRTLDYTYDAVGNRTHMRDSDGQTTVWTYDGLNCNTGITVPGQGTTAQTCYPSGKLKTITHPDGSTSDTTYDSAGRIETLIHAKAGQTLASYRYRYDANGNRVEQKEINGEGEQITEYRYDNADRLTQVIEPDRTTVYTLDPVGNRVEELVKDANGVVISDSILTYNERDQLTTRDDPATGTHVDQAYDPNGNLKTQQIGGVLRTYTYDGQDRLVELVLPNQLPIRFDYDSRGKRIEKSQGGQETRYQYDDQSLTAETNHIGNTLKRYHYSAQQLLSETLAGSTPVNRQFLLDALKTPIAVLTQTGAISARTRYDAWGRIVSQTNEAGSTVTPNRDGPIASLPSTDTQPFGFTGYVKDGESGLYYANARYYDPATARFTTEDPEAGKDLTPPSLHRYLYAYANPTVYTDRTGHQSMAEGVAWGETIGFLVDHRNSDRATYERDARALMEQQRSIAEAELGIVATTTFGGAYARAAWSAGRAAYTTWRTLGYAATVVEHGAELMGLATVGAEVVACGAANVALCPSSAMPASLPTAATRAEAQAATKLGQPSAAALATEARTATAVADGKLPAIVAEGKNGEAEFSVNATPAQLDAGAGVVGPGIPPNLSNSSQRLSEIPTPNNPTAYSVAFEMKLNPTDLGRSRGVHYNRASQALDQNLQSDPEFAQMMEGLSPGVAKAVSRTGGRETPEGWTWEHASTSVTGGTVGVMRLVPDYQHTPGSPWWRILHPDPGASGGYSEWAIPAGAPANR